jgi:phage minor structural protein
MIKTIAQDYGQELWFDTKTKTLHVYDKMGQQLGAYFSNELRLKLLTKQSTSYDYATVVYPVGKDGLLISNVNNGKPYLENFSYSNKYIEKAFVAEDIEIPEILKQKAEEYLEEIAVPRASYKVKLTDIGDNVAIGDTIMLVDKIKRIRQKQRVVKIVRYPYAPENSTIEVSNLEPNFVNSYVKGTKEVKKEISYLKKLYENLE